MEEWRDPDLEGPDDGLLDLLLDDEGRSCLSSAPLLPGLILLPGSCFVIETPAVVCRSGAESLTSGKVSVVRKKPAGNSSTSETELMSSSSISISTTAGTTTGLVSA